MTEQERPYTTRLEANFGNIPWEEIAARLGLSCERTPEEVGRGINRVITGRLARLLSQKPEIIEEATRQIEAIIAKGKEISQEDADRLALKIASRKLKKEGIPSEFREPFSQEQKLLTEFVESGEYDEVVTRFRYSAEEREPEPNIGKEEVSLQERLQRYLIGKYDFPLGEFTIEDIDRLLRNLPPFDPRKAVLRAIKEYIERNPEIKATSIEEIIERLSGEAEKTHGVIQIEPLTLYEGSLDGDGTDWTSVGEAISSHPDIAAVTFYDLDRLRKSRTVTIGIEFCPLYDFGPLSESCLIKPSQGGEGAIVNSRVGKKWGATLHSLAEIKKFLAQYDVKLNVQVVFADWAVLAGKPDDANLNVLTRHNEIYAQAVARSFEDLNVEYHFTTMLQLVGEELAKYGIKQFAVASEGEVLERIPNDLEELAKALGIERIRLSGGKDRVRKILRELLKSTGRNVEIARALFFSYCVGLPIMLKTCDLHLGMERSRLLLELPTLSPDRKPAVNILVS